MKRLGVLFLLVVLAIGGTAEANPTVPSVRKPVAKVVTERAMRREGGNWNYRTSGSINCNGGRINRTRWRCRVRWTTSNGTCISGRMQIVGAYFAQDGPRYAAHGRFAYCS